MEPIRATYALDPSTADVPSRALELALEQTAELPDDVVDALEVSDPSGFRQRFVGRVAAVDRNRVEIHYPPGATEPDAAALANLLFGNSSLQDDVRLVDFEVPASMAAAFGGPRLGIEGLRARTGATTRPLTCVALKPIGRTARELAGLCETFARAGIDVVKDDHGLVDQAAAPFGERLDACCDAIDRAADRTGRRSIYAPNLLAAPDVLRRRLERALARGVAAVLVEPYLLGLSTFHAAVEAFPDLLFIAHPAFAGTPRIAPRAALGRMLRLLGADAVVFPHAGGRFGFDEAECLAIADRLREKGPFPNRAMPVPAGGMTPDRLGELGAFYGPDTMFLVGGALYRGGAGLEQRARRFVERVHALDVGGTPT